MISCRQSVLGSDGSWTWHHTSKLTRSDTSHGVVCLSHLQANFYPPNLQLLHIYMQDISGSSDELHLNRQRSLNTHKFIKTRLWKNVAHARIMSLTQATGFLFVCAGTRLSLKASNHSEFGSPAWLEIMRSGSEESLWQYLSASQLLGSWVLLIVRDLILMSKLRDVFDSNN